jgi:hypothetical protein
MPLARDTAEELIALYNALGAIDQVNALGSVSSGTIAIAPQTTQRFTTVTLAASALAWTLPAPGVPGASLDVLVTQDGTGSRTLGAITPASGSLLWVGAAAPTLTTTAAHADLLHFESVDGVNWIGSAKLNVH